MRPRLLGLACFDPWWPVLKMAVAHSESVLFCTDWRACTVHIGASPDCARERAVSEKQFTGSLFDSPVVPWLLVGVMLATGFIAACLIVLR